jgi:WD40 repeat protein
MLRKSFKPHTLRLEGHKDTIRGLHCLGNYVLSGGEDNIVTLWDLEHKKGYKYTEHMNWITHCLLLDDYAISGAADRAVWIRPINKEEGKAD